MRPFDEIPVDVWQWLVIAGIFSLLGIRSYLSYRKKKNTISGFYGFVGIAASCTYLLWAVPALFTNDDLIIRYFTTAGDLFSVVPIASHAYLVWLIFLKPKKVRLLFPALAAIGLSIWSLYETLANSIGNAQYAYINESNEFVITSLPHAQSIMYILFFLPVSFYFAKRAMTSKVLADKVRNFALTIVYLGISILEIFSNSIDSTDQSQSSTRLIIFSAVGLFGILFFVVTRMLRK